MLKGLRNYILNKRFAGHRNKNFINWEKARSICVVATKDKFFNDRAIVNYLKMSNKEIDIVLFHPDKNSNSECYLSFNKKALDLFQFPKADVMNKLKSKHYDVLIDCNFGGNTTTNALSLSVNAECKVGHNSIGYADIFDLCLDFGNDFSIEKYLKQTVNYLSMIKTNN